MEPHETLSAMALVELCLDGERERAQADGARIQGRLELKDERVKNRLSFTDCVFEDVVDLTEARTEQPVEFIRCEFRELIADRVESNKDFILRDSRVHGRLSLVRAEVTGDLICSGSRVGSAGGALAVDAREMRIGGSVFLDQGFRAKGTVRLASSRITADLDCRGSVFENASGLSLDATHLVVTGDLILEGAESRGEINVQWSQLDGLRATGARFAKPGGKALHADNLRTKSDVRLDRDLRVEGEVRLVGAEITGELCCTEGHFANATGPAIDATRLKAGDVYLDRGFTARGEVRLIGAKIGRQVCCTGGTFESPTGYALDCDGLMCGGDVFLNRPDPHEQGSTAFRAVGEVRLIGAELGRQLNCTGGVFQNKDGDAINADGLTTPGNVFLNDGFRAEGTVRLTRATVGRQLVCTRGVFDASGLALDLSGLVGHGDVMLDRGFLATGEVRMLETNVGRDLDLTDAQLHGDDRSLSARGMTVSASLTFKLDHPPKGEVDLSLATVQCLTDTLPSWPDRIMVTGFVYRTVDSEMSVEDRLTWLSHTKTYALQNYHQLSSYYRLDGRDSEARRAAIEGYRRQRSNGNLTWPATVWNWFLDVMVGYGYRLHRPLIAFLVLGLVGTVIYHQAENHKIMMATSSPGNTNQDKSHVRCPEDYPCFQPIIYSFETITPVINLRQIGFWLPDTTKRGGPWVMAYMWLCIFVGWILGIAFTAGVTRFFKS